MTVWLLLADVQHPLLLAQQPVEATATPLPITLITHPQAGDAMAAFAPIIGSTLTRNCLKYSLDISAAGREAWQTLTVEYGCMANQELFRLDTKQYKDGYYDLRLRAIRNDGNYDEALLRGVEIRNSYPPTPTPIYDAVGSPLPTPLPTGFPIPTATQRPAITHQIPGGQGFYEPEIGETVGGYVNIVGTVYGFAGKEFQRYDLFISPRGQGQWTWLYSSEQQFWQSTLYVLDSTNFPDGYYDLALRNVYQDSNYDEFILRYVRIDNSGRPPKKRPITIIQRPGIVAPQANTIVQGLVDVQGVAVDPNFLRWDLHWSPTGAEQWAFLASSTKTAAGGTLAKLDFSNLGGITVDLRLRIVRTDYNYDEYFTRHLTVLVPPPTPTVTPTPGL